MKNTIAIISLLALFSLATPVVAGEKEIVITKTLNSDWDITLSGNVWSHYSIDGSMFADTPVFQPDLWIQHKSGFWFDIWGSVGLGEKTVFDDELDLGLGWTGDFAGLTLFMGTWYYFLEDSPIGDIWGEKLKVSKTLKFGDTLSVSPFASLTLYQSSGSVEGGNFVQLGASLEQEFLEYFTLYLKPYAMYDDGYFGLPAGWRACVDAGVKYQYDKNTSFSLDAKYMNPLHGLGGYPNDFIFGVGFTRSFGN